MGHKQTYNAYYMKSAAWAGLRNKRRLMYFCAVVLIGLSGWFIYRSRHNTQATNSDVPAAITGGGTPSQNLIQEFKNAKTPDEMRTLAAAYEQNGQYKDAKSVWQKVADKTNQLADWWSLMNVCASHQVSGRSDCVKNSVKKLKSQTKSMDFKTAYAIGARLETSGYGKLAATFYSRAVAVYKPSTDTSVSFPTKAQLQEKASALSK